MSRKAIVISVASLGVTGALVYGHHTRPAAPATAQVQAAPAQVPTIARPSSSTSAATMNGPDMDDDQGPASSRPATIASAWVPVPTTPASAAPAASIRSTGIPRGAHSVATVDVRDVDAVSKAFVTSAFVVDTAVDSSPQAGFARAAVWASPAYRPYLVAAPATSAGASWLQLRAGHGWTSATATPTTVADKPADTATSTIRSYKVVVDTTTDDGNDDQTTAYVYVTCARTSSGTWQVTSYHQLS